MEIKDNIIYEVISGSVAYGTNSPDSDTDIRGVFIPEIEYFLGTHNIEQVEDRTNDTVFYTLKRFFFLASQLNPNIVELLFMPQDCIKFIDPLFEEVLKNKTAFLSQKALYTYTGYATAQIKRIRSHYNWYRNPPSKPDLANYKDKSTYRYDFKKYHEYEEYIKNRNPKRKLLEESYGYDTKYALHIYRLLAQGEEILTKGTLHTRLSETDKNTCLDILNGKWKYEEIIQYAEDKDKFLQDVVKSGKAVVPPKVNYKFLDKLLFTLHKKRFGLY